MLHELKVTFFLSKMWIIEFKEALRNKKLRKAVRTNVILLKFRVLGDDRIGLLSNSNEPIQQYVEINKMHNRGTSLSYIFIRLNDI